MWVEPLSILTLSLTALITLASVSMSGPSTTRLVQREDCISQRRRCMLIHVGGGEGVVVSSAKVLVLIAIGRWLIAMARLIRQIVDERGQGQVGEVSVNRQRFELDAEISIYGTVTMARLTIWSSDIEINSSPSSSPARPKSTAIPIATFMSISPPNEFELPLCISR